MKPIDIWNSIQPKLKDTIGVTSYDTWFASLHVQQTDTNTLTIETPDDFFKNWIIDHYQKIITESIKTCTDDNLNINYIVNDLILNTQPSPSMPAVPKINLPQTNNIIDLNDRFTFDNFVIGSSNRFACAASLAVAESPAKAYNPLFIYGQVGLGKTHLIQSITHYIKNNQPGLKSAYLTSEKFTNELIEAIRHRSTNQFRKKYREIDVLLIDDIHFIAGKESTQEEFFHTFNYLHNNRRQIIITSDRPPKEIANLEERLSSRFAWGLIADIQPPDFETRVAILRKKIERESVNVPDDVIYFIAEQIKTNIRELEGALVRVVAYSLLEERPILLDMATIILKDMVKQSVKIISIEMILKATCHYFNVSLLDLKSKRRSRNIVIPRQVAMYLSRKLTNMSLPEIGSAFGGRDHTTVLHSCKKVDKYKDSGDIYSKSIHHLYTVLKQ
ncbi:MAG: chromosomal replication initiator protein DnaA [Candidatus Omnitrophica bacterium]|nr:chromosomal replication initiator protein DnaA [Candidatus Omnitrophota bacterium]